MTDVAVMTTGVLIIEDHRLTSETVAFLLRGHGVGSETWLGSQAAAALASDQPLPADLVLLDLDLDDGIDGSTLIPGLLERGCTVIVCSAETSLRLAACLEMGASGVVAKASSAAHVVNAVLRALAGEPAMSPDRRADLLAELHWHRADADRRLEPFKALTPYECDVLAALVDGVPASAIAAARSVSVKTVRTQIASILQKLGVRSQLQAVALAAGSGWRAR